MSIPTQRTLLALLLLSPWTIAADCDGPAAGVAERDFVASLYAPGTIGDASRSQLGRPHPANAGDMQDHLPGFPTAVQWDGTQAQVNIQMSPSIDLSAQLLDENGGAAEDSCLVLDGLGKLPDRGLRGEPVTGLIGRSLVPGEYSAVVAPDCFLRDLALAARAHDGPPLKAAESLRGGPDCPSHDIDAEADKCGWPGKSRPCTSR
mgnify:CR=1 FL=1